MDKYLYDINCIIKLSSPDTEILYISEKTGAPYEQTKNPVTNIDIPDFSLQPFCPDAVLYDKCRKQIIFVNFAEISGIFTESKVENIRGYCHCHGITGVEAVFITAFQTADMAINEYYGIADDTNVWTADAPEHTMQKIKLNR